MNNNVTKFIDDNQGCLPKGWLDSHFSEYMNIACLETLEGERYTLEFNEKFIGNPSLKAFHGGIVATFIEAVAQIHLFKEKRQGSLQLSETVTIDYLRPALSKKLLAIPEVIRIGRNVSTISVSVFQNQKVVAQGRVIFTG